MADKTLEERGLLNYLNMIDGEAEASKARSARTWEENLRLVRGEGQWKGQAPPIFQLNILGNQVERKVARVTEAKPTFSVVSRRGNLSQMARVLDQTCRGVLEMQDFVLTSERIVRFAMQVGCGFVNVCWDKAANDGEGDIAIVALDPRSVYIDPAVTEAAKLAKTARYIRIDHVWSLDQIRETFPGRGHLVTPDPRYSRYQDLRGTRPMGMLSAALDLLPRVFRPNEPNRDGPVERTILKEYWIRDPDVRTWPGGRHILRSGDIVLDDVANQYWDREPSVEMIDWRMDVSSPWGIDDIQDLKKLQESVNRLGDAIMRNALFNSQAWVIADNDALDAEQWKRVTAEGGLIVKKRPTREFRRDPPPALPNYLFQFLQAIPSMADLLTGNDDGARGRSARNTIEAVVDGLQTAGSPLARLIARRYESFVARIGQKLISRIIQFYDTDRLLTHYDLSGELINFLYERDKIRLDDQGEPVSPDEMRRLFNHFRFVVAPYSSQAMTKFQRAQTGIGLWQAASGRGFPWRRVLENADVGDPEVLMKEAREEQESGMLPPPPAPTKR